MRPRTLALLSLAASAALGSTARIRMVPPVSVQAVTVVQGNADAAAITELRLQTGCLQVRLDSIVRKVPAPDTLPRIQALGSVPPSSAVALHLSTTSPKLDSATAAACQSPKILRRIDSVPRVSVSSVVPGTDLVRETPVRARPDSLFVCLDGVCEKAPGLEIDNNQPFDRCLVGALPPIERDTAEAWIRARLASAPLVLDLHRRLFILFQVKPFCPPVIQTTTPLILAGRAASLVPDVPQETRLRYFTPWGNYFDLPQTYDWRDSSVDRTLALARSANAGDQHGVDSLRFGVSVLRAPAGETVATDFTYSTGIQRHVYNGGEQTYSCADLAWSSVRRAVGDSLLLEGVGLTITNEGCPRGNMDVFAGRYGRWLFAPPAGASWADAFGHGALLDNGSAWPIVSDSVLVRGWKFPLSSLFPTVPVQARSAVPAVLAARVEGASLRVDLPEASRVVVSTASGRILSSRDLPAGVSSLALPSGHRGVLVVSTGKAATRLFVP